MEIQWEVSKNLVAYQNAFALSREEDLLAWAGVDIESSVHAPVFVLDPDTGETNFMVDVDDGVEWKALAFHWSGTKIYVGGMYLSTKMPVLIQVDIERQRIDWSGTFTDEIYSSVAYPIVGVYFTDLDAVPAD